MPRFPWKPIRLGFDPDRQIEDAFRELIHSPWAQTTSPGDWLPDIDLFETSEFYVVEADIPGIGCEQLNVTVEPHSVTLRGSREATGIARGTQRVRVERRYGSFSRSFHLPNAVDPESIEHTCAEGLHQIRLWKVKQ